MKKKIFLLVSVLMAVLILSSCAKDGTQGPAGPAGSGGSSGPYSIIFQNGAGPVASYAGTFDGPIASGYSAFASAQASAVGGVLTYPFRYLVYFNLAGYLPTGATVDRAFLMLYGTSVTGAGVTATAYPVNQVWSEDVVSWITTNGMFDWYTYGAYSGGSGVSSSVFIPNGGFASFEITKSYVQEWLDMPSLNHGVLIKGADESGNNNTYVANREYTTVEARPKLIIYYRLP